MAQTTVLVGPGVGQQRLLDQIGEVLDPVARAHYGHDPRMVAADLAEAWRAAFGTELPEPALSRCAGAVITGQPWQLALWSDDWLPDPR